MGGPPVVFAGPQPERWYVEGNSSDHEGLGSPLVSFDHIRKDIELLWVASNHNPPEEQVLQQHDDPLED